MNRGGYEVTICEDGRVSLTLGTQVLASVVDFIEALATAVANEMPNDPILRYDFGDQGPRLNDLTQAALSALACKNVEDYPIPGEGREPVATKAVDAAVVWFDLPQGREWHHDDVDCGECCYTGTGIVGDCDEVEREKEKIVEAHVDAWGGTAGEAVFRRTVRAGLDEKEDPPICPVCASIEAGNQPHVGWRDSVGPLPDDAVEVCEPGGLVATSASVALGAVIDLFASTATIDTTPSCRRAASRDGGKQK